MSAGLLQVIVGVDFWAAVDFWVVVDFVETNFPWALYKYAVSPSSLFQINASLFQYSVFAVFVPLPL